jgi:histidine phosphotransferase ChpT
MPRQSLERLAPSAALIGADDQITSIDRADVDETPLIEMRILELLTTRLCHELSGPVAAINNGIELLDEDLEAGTPTGPAFVRDAVALVSDSAHRARNRLQFYRFAYGFSRLGASTGPAPHELAAALFSARSITFDYAESARTMSPHWQKLACNLLPVGADALPRGGRLEVSANPLTIEAAGEAAALTAEAHAALMLTLPITEVTARTVQPYFTGLLAKILGCRLIVTAEPGRVRLTAIASGI